MPVGLGLSFLPYILYLLLNKNTLNKKHYLFLFLIGLNSSLIQDFFSFIFLIPLSLLLSTKNKNLNIYLIYMKRAGIVHTNLCFFRYENVFIHLSKLHQTILRKKCNKKVYGVDIKQFETLKWWPAQKPTLKTKNTHTSHKLTV